LFRLVPLASASSRTFAASSFLRSVGDTPPKLLRPAHPSTKFT
jgi:hypothetical protein